jgi:hypothetical protein
MRGISSCCRTLIPILIAIHVLTGCNPIPTFFPISGDGFPQDPDPEFPSIVLLVYASAPLETLADAPVAEDVAELLKGPLGPDLEIHLYWHGPADAEVAPGYYHGTGAGWSGPAGSGFPALSDVSLPPPAASAADRIKWLLERPSYDYSQRILLLIGEGQDPALLSGPSESDSLMPRDLAGMLSGEEAGAQLLILDRGFGASFELACEMAPQRGSGLSPDAGKCYIGATPGPWPASGRNYGSFLQVLQAPDRPPEERDWYRDITNAGLPYGIPLSLWDSSAPEDLASRLFDLLEVLIPCLRGSANDELLRFRDSLFFSDPAYYLCPGLLRIDMLHLASHSAAIIPTCAAPGAVLERSLTDQVRHWYATGDSGSGFQDSDPYGSLSLIYVPLLPSGQADPRYPDWYRRDSEAETAFLRDIPWAPCADGDSLLSLIWEAGP